MDKSVHSKQYAVLLEMLVKRRVASGVTQVQLASKLKMTQSAYSKLERGELRLDVIQLRTILLEIGHTLTDFVAEYERAIDQQRSSRSTQRRK